MTTFDANHIADLGWQQGAVLDEGLAENAREHAPAGMPLTENEWLILTSHSCDVVNFNIDKEPVVELLRTQVLDKKKPDGQLVMGRNPRSLQFVADDDGHALVLGCKVHERWSVPRELLLAEPPARALEPRTSRHISEWLAKRYIRAAFPSEFDLRWRGDRSKNLKAWMALLTKHSRWIQGVYLRLSTMGELGFDRPYRCHLLLVMPASLRAEEDWEAERQTIEQEIDAFWSRFRPDILYDGCEVLGTDEITLADIARYQRFDADWVSFADDSDTTPPAADMTT